jgi:chorismate synthase
MASNSFGSIFRITTWGESHGKAIGVVIDGCPAGLEIDEENIYDELSLRAPGRNAYTTPRKEKDWGEILSGVFEGKTTGAPICILIKNQDADSSKYESIKELLRPGHANYTYLKKYGLFDYRGGGRASARETACRVAAGAVAKNLLRHFQIETVAYLKQMGSLTAEISLSDIQMLKTATRESPLFCPDMDMTESMIKYLEEIQKEGDSIGGVIEFVVVGLPVGLGDPIYEKLESNLAKAMMSLPASKGFEVGGGFHSATMKGSEHNDAFAMENGHIKTKTNHAGGTLGGISTGMPLIGRVAFKPPSSMKKTQETINLKGETHLFQLPEGSRHDPCVAIRAVPVVEAMAALTLADALLLNRCVRL